MAKRLIYAVLMAALLIPLAGSSPVYVGGGGAKVGPGMVLPDSVYVATDREFNAWWNQLSLITHGEPPYLFSADCDITTSLIIDRSFRVTPTAAVEDTVVFTAYDYTGQQVETKSLGIAAVPKDGGGLGLKAKVLFVGDSLMSDGNIVAEVDSLFSLDGGGDILPIGSVASNVGGVNYYHEGVSGKHWEWFTTSTSPFWNTDKIDFQNYFTSTLSATGTIDYSVVQLGANDVFGFGAALMSTSDIETIIARATAFCDTMANATYGFPDCKIIISLMPTSAYHLSGFGAGYGADNRWIFFERNLRALNRAYIAAFDAGAYSANVDVCATGLWVDNLHGYNRTLADASARETTNDYYGTNYLHPTASGNDQQADAMYSALRASVNVACANEITDSYSFTNAGNWVSISTQWTGTAGQADPWGGTTATKFVGTATPGNVYSAEVSSFQTGADDFTFSIYCKSVNLGTSDFTVIRIYNDTDSTFSDVWITWAGTPTASSSGEVTNEGITDLGSGWYQLWGTYDNSAHSTDAMKIQINPCGTPIQNDEVVIAGVQVELGVSSPCGGYVQKP